MADATPPISPQGKSQTPPPDPGKTPPETAEQGQGFFADIFQSRYREVTVSAIVFAIIIGVVMNAAITYAGLKIGFTIGGSAIAAVLGFGVLRGIMRKGSILETNIAQTIASAVNTSNSGVIFTVPVLLLIGYTLAINEADFWLITIAAVAGAYLGTAFIIPLRKQMLDIERLRFPSPTAVASILKSPGAGPAKAVVLLIGVAAGALIYLPAGLPDIKVPADVEELDELFEQGRISHEARETTLEVASWIEAEEAPAEVVARGELLHERGELEQQLSEIEAEQSEDADGPAANLREQADALQNQLDEIAIDFNDNLAEAAYLATAGEIEWHELRHTQHGWAGKGLFGYSDLNWRMPLEVDADEEPRDLDGDGVDDPVLTTRVDHDEDGRPDLIMTNKTINLGRLFGLPDQLALVFAIAPFALGAGYLTGRAGLFVLAGGILAYFIINPVAYGLGWMPESVQAHQAPDYGFSAFNRPLGIGLLLGGALMGVLFSLPAIREALRSIAAAGKIKGAGDELGLKTLAVVIVAGGIFLFLAALTVGNDPVNLDDPMTGERIEEYVAVADYSGYTIGFESEESKTTWEEWDVQQRDAFMETIHAKPGWLSGMHPFLRAAIIAIIGCIWIWFAGIIIAQCAGMTDWSPISGLALLTVVLVLLLAGTGAVVGAVMIGAALCVAITLAADMMGDMKTGYLVGAQPRRQQVMELLVVGIGPIVCMFTVLLIAQANLQEHGAAMGPGTPTVAPQAQALEAVITGVQGGELPYAMYGVGTLLGALLGLGAFPGLGVLVGISMYLPFMYISTYGIGCLVQMGVAKVKGKAWAEDWGVPFCAGLIVGESVLALLINAYILATGA